MSWPYFKVERRSSHHTKMLPQLLMSGRGIVILGDKNMGKAHIKFIFGDKSSSK